MTDRLPFSIAVSDETGGHPKVQSRSYLASGILPVVDQGKAEIGGYTNDLDAAYNGPLPCVIFGDHTKIIKFVNYRFALGADGIKVLLPRDDRITARFLYHYLCWIRLPDAGYSRHFKFLKEILVPAPLLYEQRRIVGLLDRAAEIRRRADAARAKARAIIPALFLDMFGDPATNPKGWRSAALSVVADISSGLTKGRKLNGQQTKPTPYLRVANVQDGFLDLSEIKMIDATDTDIAKCSLRVGDLLMTEGGDPDKLGRCAIWRDAVPGCVHQNHIFRVRVRNELHPEFAAAFIQSDAGKGYFLRIAKRTTGIATINKTQLGALQMLVPPLPLQTAFAEQVTRIESIAHALDAAAAKAEAMAAALSTEVFG